MVQSIEVLDLQTQGPDFDTQTNEKTKGHVGWFL